MIVCLTCVQADFDNLALVFNKEMFRCCFYRISMFDYVVKRISQRFRARFPQRRLLWQNRLSEVTFFCRNMIYESSPQAARFMQGKRKIHFAEKGGPTGWVFFIAESLCRAASSHPPLNPELRKRGDGKKRSDSSSRRAAQQIMFTD